jgi:hypothetical protein
MGSFASITRCHNHLSFQQIAKLVCRETFNILPAGGCRVVASGCYIIFSGFPTSPLSCTQEQKMYTTNVTVGTADASKRKTKQGKYSWRRYLTAAPIPWLA